jgi:5-methylcytosine-specific restriction endonuclease McrA
LTFWRIYYRQRGGCMSANPTEVVEGEEERDRIMARRSPKAVHYELAKMHTCSRCGFEGPWTKEWSWFGSWKMIDESRPVKKFCSPACAKKMPVRKPKPDGISWKEHQVPMTMEAVPHDEKRSTWDALHAAREAPTKHRKVPMPDVKPGSGSCRWCALPIYHDRGKKKGLLAENRSWHTPCYNEYLRFTDRNAQAHFLRDRDGPWCAICGPAEGRWVGKRIWHDPVKETGVTEIEWSFTTEVDHIIPLWKAADYQDWLTRRRLYGPENLWLICGSCHKAKTRLEAAERAARKRAAAD